jgi:hypothetical protein
MTKNEIQKRHAEYKEKVGGKIPAHCWAENAIEFSMNIMRL